jgi:hypothetical protein
VCIGEDSRPHKSNREPQRNTDEHRLPNRSSQALAIGPRMAEGGDVLGVGSCFRCSYPFEFGEERLAVSVTCCVARGLCDSVPSGSLGKNGAREEMTQGCAVAGSKLVGIATECSGEESPSGLRLSGVRR